MSLISPNGCVRFPRRRGAPWSGGRRSALPKPDRRRGRGMIEKIVPGGVACAEAFADPPDAVLFPQEEALVAGAAGSRRREFATGRHCARTALAALGVAQAPVLRGERGEPRWPPGIVGS